MRTWDAIVVGGRVAGAATAMLLARAGLSVLCVDRARYGSDTLSTHALMRAGVLQLQRWGLVEPVLAAGTPAVRRTVFHYGPDTVEVSIKAAAGVDALYAPRRTVLDALLVDAAARAGVSFQFSTPVSGLVRDADGRVCGVRVAAPGARSPRIERAGLVIGADGRNSVVAAAVSAAVEATGRYAGSYLYGYWADLPTDGFEWFYAPGVTAGAIPTNAGLTCLFVGGTSAQLRSSRSSASTSLFSGLARTAGLGDRLDTATLAEPLRRVRGLPPGNLRRAYGPGWALVGDAGHWLDPISTHGMTSALRDADLLSRAAVSHLGGADRGLASFARYQAERDRLSKPMLQIADAIASHAWTLDQVRHLLRRLASAMADEVEALATATTVGRGDPPRLRLAVRRDRF